MFLRSGWCGVRSALLAKGGTLEKGLSPHLHKFPTWSNNVSPRTFQTALVSQTLVYAGNDDMLKENINTIKNNAK
jgi:hypothetical protein